MVVIDLSKPKELWGTLTGVIKGIRERVDRVLSDLIAKDSRLPAYLRKKASKPAHVHARTHARTHARAPAHLSDCASINGL